MKTRSGPAIRSSWNCTSRSRSIVIRSASGSISWRMPRSATTPDVDGRPAVDGVDGTGAGGRGGGDDAAATGGTAATRGASATTGSGNGNRGPEAAADAGAGTGGLTGGAAALTVVRSRRATCSGTRAENVLPGKRT